MSRRELENRTEFMRRVQARSLLLFVKQTDELLNYQTDEKKLRLRAESWLEVLIQQPHNGIERRINTHLQDSSYFIKMPVNTSRNTADSFPYLPKYTEEAA